MFLTALLVAVIAVGVGVVVRGSGGVMLANPSVIFKVARRLAVGLPTEGHLFRRRAFPNEREQCQVQSAHPYGDDAWRLVEQPGAVGLDRQRVFSGFSVLTNVPLSWSAGGLAGVVGGGGFGSSAIRCLPLFPCGPLDVDDLRLAHRNYAAREVRHALQRIVPRRIRRGWSLVHRFFLRLPRLRCGLLAASRCTHRKVAPINC